MLVERVEYVNEEDVNDVILKKKTLLYNSLYYRLCYR